MKRYGLQVGEGASPTDLSGWLRRTMYDVVRGDRQADAGQRHYEAELGVLLRQVTTSPARRVRPDLVQRAVAHLHPRDRLLLRLRLHGHERSEVATRLGTTPAAVDQAYRRSRHRLRAAIEHDQELLAHLRELSRPARWSRVDSQRPRSA
jgi:DNA-directed RNA polymerase specialized sigma24 family protein